MIKITKELQALVKKNTKIKKIFFDADGNHYFMAHKITVHEVDGDGFSTKSKEVESLPGAKKEAVKIIVDGRKGKVIDKFVNVHFTPVDYEMTREQVLSAKPTVQSMSDDEKLEILTKASAIAKDDNFQELLKKIK